MGDHIDSIALEALFKAKALEECRFHPEVTIRLGNEDAEKHAYALATTIAKAKDEMFIREDLMESIKDALDMAADGECPACASLRDK